MKKITLDLTDVKDGMSVEIVDLHNGSLKERLLSFANAIAHQDSGKTRIRVLESSLHIFISDIFEFLTGRGVHFQVSVPDTTSTATTKEIGAKESAEINT